MSLEGGKSVLQPKAFTSDVAVTTVEIGRGRPLEDSRSEFKTVPKSVDKRSEAASVGANHIGSGAPCRYREHPGSKLTLKTKALRRWQKQVLQVLEMARCPAKWRC